MRNRCVRQHAVTEIEDKRARRKSLEDHIDRPIERFAAGEQRQADQDCPAPAVCSEFDRAQNRARSSNRARQHRPELLRCIAQALLPAPRGNPMILASGTTSRTAVDNSRAWRDAPSLEFVRRQHACPSIENLHGVDAGLELPDQIALPRPRPTLSINSANASG